MIKIKHTHGYYLVDDYEWTYTQCICLPKGSRRHRKFDNPPENYIWIEDYDYIVDKFHLYLRRWANMYHTNWFDETEILSD